MATPDEILSVRDLVPDDAAVFGDAQNEYIFSDEQIGRIFESVGKGSILRTVGLLCISLGNSEALIEKVIKTQDLSTNGAALQESWGKRGEYYIGLADKEDTFIADAYFNVIDYRQGWQTERPELTEWGILG
jgi:hypothetical protein